MLNFKMANQLRRLWDALRYRMKLLAQGRFDLVWYAIRCRVKGFDLGSVPLEKLGLTPERSVFHGNSGGPDLERILKMVEILPGSRVLDFGSGKGGAVLTLSEFPFAEIVGVELSPDLIRIAEANIHRAGLRQVHFIRADASNFADLDRFTHIYMYHPFPCPVVKDVMTNLARSLGRRERDITLIYTNPVCHETILASGLFQVDRQFQARDPFFIYVHRSPGMRDGETQMA